MTNSSLSSALNMYLLLRIHQRCETNILLVNVITKMSCAAEAEDKAATVYNNLVQGPQK